MMRNPHGAHIKITLIPNNAAPDEITDGDIWFMHAQPGGGTFTLNAKIKIMGRDDYEQELYTQTQNYSPHGVHQRIFNFRSPKTPGVYEVIASVLSESGEELEASKSMLIVRIE